MSEWGGTDADSLRNGIESIFSETGRLPTPDFQTKLVGITSDGASVNTGRINGLMTQLAEGRDWLIKIHCVNHRIELAVKSAFQNTSFNVIDELYNTIYYLFKNSGKIKGEVKAAAEALNINHYSLPRLTGTRFVGHRLKAYGHLLDNWPSLITGFENVACDVKTKAETKAKVKGILKKLKSYRYLMMTCAYLDILQIITPASKVFESETIALHEIKVVVDETLNNIDMDVEAAGTDEEMLNSYSSRFIVVNGQLESTFIKGNDNRRKLADRERITLKLPFFGMTEIDDHVRGQISSLKKNTLVDLKELLEARFNDYNQTVFNTMKWYDPKNWTDEKNYGIEEINKFYTHFEVPLNESGFDKIVATREWIMLKSYVKANFPGGIKAHALWKHVFLYKLKEYPNVSKMAELVMVLSASNSTVERAFSILTAMLSDKRLLLKHTSLQDLMIIKINDKIWSVAEREEILESALNTYMSKRRTTQLSSPVSKSARIDEQSSSSSDDSDSSVSDHSENESD